MRISQDAQEFADDVFAVKREEITRKYISEINRLTLGVPLDFRRNALAQEQYLHLCVDLFQARIDSYFDAFRGENIIPDEGDYNDICRQLDEVIEELKREEIITQAVAEEYKKQIEPAIRKLRTSFKQAQFEESRAATNTSRPSMNPPPSKKQEAQNVFVVHGRNLEARNSLFRFLRSIGLRPLEWSQAIQLTGKASPFIGEILDVAFSKAQAVIVLLTPDDETRLRPPFVSITDPAYESEATGQARPNVLFEAGMAIARNPDRTVIVELGNLRPFSDISGRHVVKLSNSSEARHELAQRLETAGCPVDLTGKDWLTEGDFRLESDDQKTKNNVLKEESRTANEVNQLLRVFLCHSSDDKPTVRDIYRKLKSHSGLKPWLDEEDLVAGQDWELEIRKAVKDSDAIVACLSNGSVNKKGFVQKEIKYALDVADEQPEGTIFLIPLRLEECEVPDRLSNKHWVDYFRPDGYERLLTALRACAQRLGIKISNPEGSEGREQSLRKGGSSSYVRRDEKGRFYESDDIYRSLKLDVENQKNEGGFSRKGSERRSKRLTHRDWHNPQVACSLLSNIRGLQTEAYKTTGTEDDFFCCSPYKDLDHESPLPNNVAYYAEGDANEVNRLKLVLNVNDPKKAEEAHRALLIYSNELACKALGEELSPKMQEAILAGHPEAYMVGELFVELKREAWPTGRGYEMKFIITQPANISSPFKAIESKEVTKPKTLHKFFETDSNVGSPADLPTSDLNYEPDEAARRILVFLAEPQHQHVYAVEIGNSLGLPQTRVKSYLDKLAEEDYVRVTRDSRTNMDVCTITPQGKQFLDKPE